MSNSKKYTNLIKRLTKANMLEAQAEAIAREFEIHDLEISKEYLDLKLKEMVAITDARIEFVRSDILKWFVGIIFVQTLTIVISIFFSNQLI